MLIRDAYTRFVANLIDGDIPESKLLCSILLCKTLKLDKAQLYSHMEDKISDDDFNEVSFKINLLLNHVPIQYVTGHQEFMSLNFLVNSDVLIPRQDTETLVETVISTLVDSKIVSPRILELGTGSGCISVSLAHYISNSNIVSVDISEQAIAIACKNAVINNVSERIKFIQGDMLIKDLYINKLQDTINLNGMFDVIVSNPPYIPTEDIKDLESNVRQHEPHMALDGGKDGLDFYTSVAAFAPIVLKENGLIFLEAGFDTILPACNIINKNFHNVQIVKDINKINRVIYGNLK